MLETIHEYAKERLLATAEVVALQQQHAAYFLTLTEQAEPALVTDKQTEWLDRLDVEQANFRAGLEWSISPAGSAALGLRLAVALCQFWEVRGHYREASRWLETLLARTDEGAPAILFNAYSGAGTMAWHQGDYARATRFHEQAVKIAREIGDEPGITFALNNLGVQAMDQGDYAQAEVLLTESLAYARDSGDLKLIGYALNNLGEVARYQREYSRAAPFYEEALTLSERLAAKDVTAMLLFNLAEVTRLDGEDRRAADHYKASLNLAAALGHQYIISLGLTGCVGLAVSRGNVRQAVVLSGAVNALMDATGRIHSPGERGQYEENVAAARGQLGEAAFTVAIAEGQAMTVEQAITYALASIK